MEKAGKPTDPQVLFTLIDLRSALRDLARLNYRQRDDSQIETVETRILVIDEKALGPDSLEAGNDSQSLGQLNEHEARHGAAFPLLLRALEIIRKAYRKDSSVSTRTYRVRRQPVLMPELSFLGRMHQGRSWTPDGDTLTTCSINKELAKVGAESGKYTEAERLCKQIVGLDEKGAASNHEFKIRELADDLSGIL